MKKFGKFISNNEEWLIERILFYAKKQNYVKYTSTLLEAWRLSIAGLSGSILEAIKAYREAPELEPEEDYQNLIENAIKFSGEEKPKIKVTAKKVDDNWILGVKDNGIGLNHEYGEKIFVPFKRLHGRSKYKGSGIGLSIVRKIIELHEGKIWV